MKVRPGHKHNAGLTLLESLIVCAAVAILAAVLIPAVIGTVDRGAEAKSASNLRQLALATIAYANEHGGSLFRYRENTPQGVRWYFGFETAHSMSQPEGSRVVDRDAGPLAPYIENAHWVTVCPGFLKYTGMRKPKYGDWVTGGYGVNVLITGGVMGAVAPARLSSISEASQIWLFGTCAQINTFQPPASAKNPMLEEFYFFDHRELTVHFRFSRGTRALFAHLDGSVRPYSPVLLDTRRDGAHVGRATPVNSFLHLRP